MEYLHKKYFEMRLMKITFCIPHHHVYLSRKKIEKILRMFKVRFYLESRFMFLDPSIYIYRAYQQYPDGRAFRQVPAE
jgi:hypothetical protein